MESSNVVSGRPYAFVFSVFFVVSSWGVGDGDFFHHREHKDHKGFNVPSAVFPFPDDCRFRVEMFGGFVRLRCGRISYMEGIAVGMDLLPVFLRYSGGFVTLCVLCGFIGGVGMEISFYHKEHKDHKGFNVSSVVFRFPPTCRFRVEMFGGFVRLRCGRISCKAKSFMGMDVCPIMFQHSCVFMILCAPCGFI